MYSFGELLWRNQSIPVSTPILETSLLGTNVVRVAAGGFHCGALSDNGSVYTWGENTAGQCGLAEGGAAANITSQFQTRPSFPSSIYTYSSFSSTVCLFSVLVLLLRLSVISTPIIQILIFSAQVYLAKSLIDCVPLLLILLFSPQAILIKKQKCHVSEAV